MVVLNEAEQQFTAYLESHGYTWSHEPDYQTELGLPTLPATKPDFLVARGGMRAVFEVRQFETTAIRDALVLAGGYMSTGPRKAYKSLRSALVEKAKQLRPLTGAGLPLVIVLANPLGTDVILDEHHVTAAMFGNPSFNIPIDPATGGAPEGAQMHWTLENYGVFCSPVLEGGEIRSWENRNPHVSAVAVVHERLYSTDWHEEIVDRYPPANASMEAAVDAVFEAHQQVAAGVAAGEEPKGAYQWISLYEIDGQDAVPLPTDWFGGLRDERHGSHPDTGGYGRKHPGTSG
jgi:hypothetical protein